MAVGKVFNPADAKAKQPVEVSGTILHETSAALLLEVEGTGIWFPLSTIHEIHRAVGIEDSRILVDEWIAHKKGLC